MVTNITGVMDEWTKRCGNGNVPVVFLPGHNKRSNRILRTANNLMVRANLWTKHNYQSGKLEESKSAISEIIVLQGRKVLCGTQSLF
jgi:hypothetical protein